MDKIQYLKKLDKIVIPEEFTYFNHSTCFIPTKIHEKLANGKYVKSWTTIPIEPFTIKSEMSFVERNGRIHDCLTYQNPLSSASIMYKLHDYAKPFIIRVIMPKRTHINNENLSEDYRQELQNIYMGLGDGRHEKLPNNTRLIPFASTQVDEISGKKIDIIYCIREQDLDWYTSLVQNKIAKGLVRDFVVPEGITRNSKFDFIEGNYMIEKDYDFSRFLRGENEYSDYEQEYYNEYSALIEKNLSNKVIGNLSWEDRSKIYSMYENMYASKHNKKK